MSEHAEELGFLLSCPTGRCLVTRAKMPAVPAKGTQKGRAAVLQQGTLQVQLRWLEHPQQRDPSLSPRKEISLIPWLRSQAEEADCSHHLHLTHAVTATWPDFSRPH